MKRNMVLCYFAIRTWAVNSGVRVARSLAFCVGLSFFFWSFCCLSFFDTDYPFVIFKLFLINRFIVIISIIIIIIIIILNLLSN
jgi:hypothetical protein